MRQTNASSSKKWILELSITVIMYNGKDPKKFYTQASGIGNVPEIAIKFQFFLSMF